MRRAAFHVSVAFASPQRDNAAAAALRARGVATLKAEMNRRKALEAGRESMCENVESTNNVARHHAPLLMDEAKNEAETWRASRPKTPKGGGRGKGHRRPGRNRGLQPGRKIGIFWCSYSCIQNGNPLLYRSDVDPSITHHAQHDAESSLVIFRVVIFE